MLSKRRGDVTAMTWVRTGGPPQQGAGAPELVGEGGTPGQHRPVGVLPHVLVGRRLRAGTCRQGEATPWSQGTSPRRLQRHRGRNSVVIASQGTQLCGHRGHDPAGTASQGA